jgi:hypothetical protein
MDRARRFSRANQTKLAEMLETLTALGQATKAENGRYQA